MWGKILYESEGNIIKKKWTQVDAGAAAAQKAESQKGWGWGYLSPFALKAPPLDKDHPR